MDFLLELDLVVCLVALALTFFVVKAVYRSFFHPLAKFPGPRTAAISKLYEGYHVLVKNDWLENLEALHKKHGPIVRIGPNELHFTDHEFCLAHHKRSDLRKCSNYYGILPTLMSGLFNPREHKERKSIIQPLWSGSNLLQFSRTTMNDHLAMFYQRLSEANLSHTRPPERLERGPAPVNITHYLFALANDIMVSYLVGKDMGYLKEPDLAKVHDRMRAYRSIEFATLLRSMPPARMVLDMFPSLRRFSPLHWLDVLVMEHLKPIIQQQQTCFSTEKQDVSEKSTTGGPKRDGPTVLSALYNNLRIPYRSEAFPNPTPQARIQLVQQESSQAIFIGNESLLSNLTFALHHLMQNPECVTKIRREMDRYLDIGTYGHSVWRDEKVLQLPYLDAVCRESSRLSAPGWHRQPRQIDEPIEYNGTVIPPMTSMSFTPSFLERDPILFPDEPEKFKPERWLGPDGAKMKRDSITFGTGTRTCLGQFLARQVLRKTLACIVYNFDISAWDGEKDAAEGYRYLVTYPRCEQDGTFLCRIESRFRAIC